MNFREYLNRIRLSYAEQLITTTDRPLTEIWAESGFESQSSFNRVFREAEGMTPARIPRTRAEIRRTGQSKAPRARRALALRAGAVLILGER